MATLLKTLTPEQVDEISPPYPPDHPVIVPASRLAARDSHSGSIEEPSQRSPHPWKSSRAASRDWTPC